jgi:3'-5' exoribonuclease
MAHLLDIPTLSLGTRVQDTFLVIDLDVRTMDSGDSFTIVKLGNSTGTIASEPFWPERHDEIAGVRKGHPVQVVGEVASYKDRRQLKIASLRVLPKDSVDLTSLVPSVDSVERYWETLDGWRRSITKPRLRTVVDLFYEDDDFRKAYEACPASIRGHHALLGGLLQHTTEVAVIARAIARAVNADLDLVLAGVLLHDIGKLESYTWDGLFDFTKRGRLVGHVTLGALMFDRRLRAERDAPCNAEERDVLLHLILSHHGRLEYGSPVQPMTLEAEVLHWADNASAKTRSVADAIANPENFPDDGPVSRSLWQIDRRRVYREESGWGEEEGTRSSSESP